MALVEREALLADLHRYAQEAQRREGRIVLVQGEAGGGKSALVERFQSELPDATWSWGTCDGLTTPRPLAPLFDLAVELGGRLQTLTRGTAGRDELFRALLAQLADSDRLQVIVVEDVHWADDATFDLLRFLARRIRTAAVLMIVTYRDVAQTQAASLRLALGELATVRWSRRLQVAPLSAEAVQLLTAGTDLDAHALFELTGGNPFYVTEMIQAGTHGVPLTARDAVLARAARLSEQGWTVLAVASLIGTRIEPALLGAATQCSPEVLDELIASALLVDDGTGLRFRHEIVRLAVDQQIPSHRRTVIHADILAALRSAGASDDSMMAFHAEGARDVAGIVHHAARAAHRAAQLGSHREATAQYERALRASAGAEPLTVAQLYSELAESAALNDDIELAAKSDVEALALWRRLGNQLKEGAILRHYSYQLQHLCCGEEAVAAAVQAIDVLEPLGPTAELAGAISMLATQRMMRGEDDDALRLAQQARAVALAVGAIDVVADTFNTEGCARAGTDPLWVEYVRRALELALSSDLRPQAARAYSNLHGLLCTQYRYRESEQYYVDGIAYCEEHDLDTYANCMHVMQLEALLNQGNWDGVIAIADKMLAEQTIAPMTQICLAIRVGKIQARRGEQTTWATLDRAISAAVDTAQPQYIVPVRLARAEAHWLEGRLDDARWEAESAAESLQGVIDPWAYGAVNSWLLRTGSNRSMGGELPEPYRLAQLGRQTEAARTWEGLGCGYDAALVLFDSGDPSLLREALGLFDALGATAAGRVTRQFLRQLGERSIPAGPRRATRAHPLGLTPREHDVLDLIHAHRTNAEIAQELFISAKTVDHHVSAVLAKLAAPNRAAAASIAAELGLVGTPR
jgi:DNA-binding CsgD family transcriptional regulator